MKSLFKLYVKNVRPYLTKIRRFNRKVKKAIAAFIKVMKK